MIYDRYMNKDIYIPYHTVISVIRCGCNVT
jgi:hypothetical protein